MDSNEEQSAGSGANVLVSVPSEAVKIRAGLTQPCMVVVAAGPGHSESGS